MNLDLSPKVGRTINVGKMLAAFLGMLRYSNLQCRRVLFFCRRGERQSAAVLMVVLCEIFHFSRNAAKLQIEDMRSVAKITTEPEGAFPPSWDEVSGRLDAL